MNAQTRIPSRFFLLLIPALMMACSFSANLDLEQKATAAVFSTSTPVAFSTSTPVYPPSDPPPADIYDVTATAPCSLAGEPQPVSSALGVNLALDKPVTGHAGGVDYAAWGNARDAAGYGTTTLAEKGRWGNNTNAGSGSYEIVDLGREYTLTGVGYSLDWDRAFANPLTFQVRVSTDSETWTLVTSTVHRFAGNTGGHQVDIDLAIAPIRARYVEYREPPDGAWNGWGDFFQLRAYAEE